MEREEIIAQLLELTTEIINTAEEAQLEHDDFYLVSELAEQLREELTALQE